MKKPPIVLFVLLAPLICAQTQVDLKNQGKNVDFSSATATRPLKTGALLPASCSVGDMYFRTDSAPGANVFICTSANVWTVQSGAVSLSELADLGAVRASATSLVVGGSCFLATPCNYRYGNVTYSITAPATVTVSGGTGAIRVYGTPSGGLTVGHNVTAACDGGCTAQSGVTAFPADSIPLFSWTVTSGALDVNGGTDARAFLSAKTILPGTGMRSVESNGVTTLAVDDATVSLRAGTPATAADACSAGTWAADSGFYYLCVAANTWKRVALLVW